jgi:hypothetical protein
MHTYASFTKLSWQLLEAKIKYYQYPHMITMSDATYDILEKEYMQACIDLNQPNTIQSMVGVDLNRPSVQCAIHKILSVSSKK